MQTFTTKGATDLLYADDFRSNGCPDVWVLLNESGSIGLEALTGEIESAAEALEILIESDVIPDRAPQLCSGAQCTCIRFMGDHRKSRRNNATI